MRPRSTKLALAVAFVIAFALGLTTTMGRALIEVSQGYGASTYKNVYGMPIHSTS